MTSFPSLAFYGTSVATADFNEDGNLDLVLGASSDGGAVVIPGNGDGGFGQPIALAVGSMGVVTATDFNGDGHVDIAYAGSDPNTISVAFGRGDGTFGSPRVYPLPAVFSAITPRAATSLTPIDFDHDGLTDLIVAANAMSIMKGLPDGGFEVSSSIGSDYETQRALPLDADCDGKLDLVSVGNLMLDGGLFFGAGFIGFVQVGSGSFGGSSIVAADFNADGIPDLLLSGAGARGQLLRGRGDGSFLGPFALPIPTREPGQIYLADFNSDGLPDVLFPSGNGTVEVAFDDPTLGFTFGPNLSVPNTQALALGDFNSDGNIDFVSVSRSRVSISAFLAGRDQSIDAGSPDAGEATVGTCQPLGDGGAAMPYGWTDVYGFIGSPIALAVADFNQDGRSDFAVLSNYGLDTYVGLDDGGFEGVDEYLDASISPGQSLFPMLQSGDLNGDGMLDLATSTWRDVLLFFGDGSGGFSPPVEVQLPSAAVNAAALAMAIGDVDADGRSELVIFDTDGTLYLGHFDQSCDSHISWTSLATLTGNFTVNTVGLALGDIDGDGRMDVVLASQGDVYLFKQEAAGRFSRSSISTPMFGLNTVAIGDVTGDGRADLVVAGIQLGVLAGLSDGGFGVPTPRAEVFGANQIQIKDVTGDGINDVVAVNRDSGDVVVLPGGPSGLGTATTYPSGVLPVAAVATDVDGDGLPDFIVATSTGTNVLRSVPPPAARNWMSLPLRYPKSLAMTDLDGNGTSDIVEADGRSVSLTFSCAGGAARTDTYALQGAGPLTTFDVDGDGRPEVITTSQAGNSTALTTLWLADGGGISGAVTIPSASSASVVLHADINNDGIEDLVTVEGLVEISVGRGGGLFDLPLVLPSYGAAQAAVADFNGDGNQDVFVIQNTYGQATELVGDGKFGFTARDSFTPCTDPLGSETADLDGDGLPDVVLLCGNSEPGPSWQSPSIAVLRSRGDGTFDAPRYFPVGAEPTSMTLADVDGDGLLDAIVTDFSRNIVVLRGLPNAEFGIGRGFVVPGAQSVYAGDFNGDGKQDLVIFGPRQPTLILGQ